MRGNVCSEVSLSPPPMLVDHLSSVMSIVEQSVEQPDRPSWSDQLIHPDPNRDVKHLGEAYGSPPPEQNSNSQIRSYPVYGFTTTLDSGVPFNDVHFIRDYDNLLCQLLERHHWPLSLRLPESGNQQGQTTQKKLHLLELDTKIRIKRLRQDNNLILQHCKNFQDRLLTSLPNPDFLVPFNSRGTLDNVRPVLEINETSTKTAVYDLLRHVETIFGRLTTDPVDVIQEQGTGTRELRPDIEITLNNRTVITSECKTSRVLEMEREDLEKLMRSAEFKHPRFIESHALRRKLLKAKRMANGNVDKLRAELKKMEATGDITNLEEQSILELNRLQEWELEEPSTAKSIILQVWGHLIKKQSHWGVLMSLEFTWVFRRDAASDTLSVSKCYWRKHCSLLYILVIVLWAASSELLDQKDLGEDTKICVPLPCKEPKNRPNNDKGSGDNTRGAPKRPATLSAQGTGGYRKSVGWSYAWKMSLVAGWMVGSGILMLVIHALLLFLAFSTYSINLIHMTILNVFPLDILKRHLSRWVLVSILTSFELQLIYNEEELIPAIMTRYTGVSTGYLQKVLVCWRPVLRMCYIAGGASSMVWHGRFGPLPIVAKLALPGRSADLLEEYEVLAQNKGLPIPIVYGYFVHPFRYTVILMEDCGRCLDPAVDLDSLQGALGDRYRNAVKLIEEAGLEVCDPRPENVLEDADGKVTLIDFVHCG